MTFKFSKSALLASTILFAGLAGSQARAEFAGQGTYAGTSAGTANAQTIAVANLAVMSQLRGVTISWTVGSGLTNTGAATVGVGAISPVAIDRMAGGALVPLAGGEMPAGKMIKAFFDGTELVLLTNYAAGALPGQVAYFDSASCPSGWSAANGTNNTVNVTGQFIRALNTGSTGVDPSRTLASVESNSVQPLGVGVTNGDMHVGTFNGGSNEGSGGLTNYGDHIITSSDFSVTGTGTETRPQNVALLACQAN